MSDQTSAAIPIKRGCGTRKKGGIYAECGLDPVMGAPVETFLIDPPMELGIAIPPRGVLLTTVQNVPVLVDHVGSAFYPNVADFVEEVRVAGVSRRLPLDLDYGALTPETMLLLTHEKACIANASDLPKPWSCAKRREEHEQPDYELTCSWHWWHDVVGGRALSAEEQAQCPDLARKYVRVTSRPCWVEREMPSFKYRAHAWAGDEPPRYREAAFMMVGLSRLVVIRDPQEGTHERALELASKGKLKVEVVDE